MTTPTADARPRLLVVGGLGGLVGRALLSEFSATHQIRSVHRHPVEAERDAGVEFVARDVAAVADWGPLLDDVDVVVSLPWYREGRRREFGPLSDALVRLVRAAADRDVRRFVQLSVPDGPAHLEGSLPYFVRRRAVDRAVAESPLHFAIVRPTMLFGSGDKLATVMLRTIHRWGRLPLFGDGRYHLSPVSTRDLARIVRREGELGARRTVTFGGPTRYEYRTLAEGMFAALGRQPRFLRLSPSGGIRLARLLEMLRSTLLYPYEVEWLLSDTLGVPAYEGLVGPLAPIEPFLAEEATRLRRSAATGRPA